MNFQSIRDNLKTYSANALSKAKTYRKPLAALAGLLFLAWAFHPSTSNDMVNSSVMITNFARTSGGTGIVIESSETSSSVLTNSHVCHLVENAGGLVTGKAGSFAVATYKHSPSHDLCMITVAGNLRARTTLAAYGPNTYYEKASVSGHPALYPNVVTTGHFSGRQVITVMIGSRACTAEDLADPQKMFLCAFLGGIPIVKSYDSTLVTATIMPGSSGSGVYNKNNELAGVVFAGSGNLGYAWTVPYEYVYNFLSGEQYALDAKTPSNLVDIFSAQGEKKDFDQGVFFNNLKNVCAGAERVKIKDICRMSDENMVWFK